MESGLPLCDFCKHYRGYQIDKAAGNVRFICDAFPTGIPQEIYFEQGDHRQPYDGDHGIHFEKIEGKTLPASLLH